MVPAFLQFHAPSRREASNFGDSCRQGNDPRGITARRASDRANESRVLRQGTACVSLPPDAAYDPHPDLFREENLT
jgi:hypothetical protein